MKDKEAYLAKWFLFIYQQGIMTGINRCDKTTGLFSIKNHVSGKGNSFMKLAQKCVKELGK
jgi:hypothetical protein